jgi:hypothetical protein
MLCCLRLEKHDTNGYEYVDMTGRKEYEDLSAMRKSRATLAKALLSNDISIVPTEIRTTNSEIFDVFVVGREADVSTIGKVWDVETHMALGMAYDQISAWMTIQPSVKNGEAPIADDRTFFIIRDKDAESFKKGTERLGKFLVDAVKYVQSLETEEEYA